MAEEDKNVNKLIRALAKDSGEHDEEKSSFPFSLGLFIGGMLWFY